MVGLAFTLVSFGATLSQPEHGLYGWGVGFEVPVFGVVSGIGTESEPGVGFMFGGALDYQLTREASVRVFGQYSETFAGRAEVEFDLDKGRQRQPLDAEYFAVNAGLGFSYAFRGQRLWAPYVGLDAGGVFGGFDYNFGQDEQGLRAVEEGREQGVCSDASCLSDLTDSAQMTWFVAARGGFQFDLTQWLRSAVDLSVSVVPLDVEPISNTIRSRNVTGLRESLVLVTLSYIARIGF